MDVNANVFPLSGAHRKLKNWQILVKKLLVVGIHKLQQRRWKMFQILMTKFLVAGTIPATTVFFHKYRMLPKKQNLLCRWMNLPTKNLKPGNSDISVVINVINKYRITLSGKQLAGKCGLNACHTEWPYVVDILYWSLVEGLITAGSTFICQKSAVSLLWGYVIWVNFLVEILKTINVSVNGACIPLAVQDRIDMVVTLSTG